MNTYNYLLQHNISNSAKRFPERPAFRCISHEVSYSELDIISNQVANMLLANGLMKGERVGVLMNRCLETSFAIYGILKAGGVVVALNPQLPMDRLKWLIKDCGIKSLLTNSACDRITKQLIDSVKALFYLDKGIYQSQPKDFICPYRILESDLAYILYTSGSTGTPKGIMHTHNSGLAYAKLTAELFEITENDRIANHAPIFFDISTLGYYTGPLVGACTVIISDAQIMMHPSLAQLIEEEKITVWYSVPLALIQLLKTKLLSADNKDMRLVVYAGEAFSPKYLQMLNELWPKAEICNVYGPTETNQCTHYFIPSDYHESQEIPIGMVWGNTDYIIDQDELLIRSATCMTGYWNNRELTDRSFKSVESSSGTTEKYYKTGDLVKLGSDGLLYLIGRKDHQIKYRGFRIELGDIENAFLNHENVEEAIAIPLILDGKIVEIRIAIKLGKPTKEKELISHCKIYLPIYAVPSKILILDDFPRTSTGKVKRAAINQLISNV